MIRVNTDAHSVCNLMEKNSLSMMLVLAPRLLNFFMLNPTELEIDHAHKC